MAPKAAAKPAVVALAESLDSCNAGRPKTRTERVAMLTRAEKAEREGIAIRTGGNEKFGGFASSPKQASCKIWQF